MPDRCQRCTPQPQQIVRSLKNHFDGPWTLRAETRWELRFLFQLVEPAPGRFQINIAMVANAGSTGRQRALYLSLCGTRERLQLSWPRQLNRPFERVREDFHFLYPLERFIFDIRTALVGHPFELNIPEINPGMGLCIA